MPKNPTDAWRAVVFGCVRIRQHRDTAEVAEPLIKYVAAGSTKVYVIGGVADKGGFSVVLWGLLDHWRSKITTMLAVTASS